ncbi:hypothetical protein F3Y22_tig00110940pilonHSYRG00456 [Hibiscus syriacus]|uniref:Pectate lyase n=1 Tax=Hibiscus syriacus TaxID=106335 RepID=A0A6A2ZCA2_HIBSY|nr:hypothetical protein F3Y22_tig00110940pilonHSYRG00456 [Hibiscus syriacus]
MIKSCFWDRVMTTQDKDMQVTVAFNHFGEALVQRMPRCRHGYFHVVNNDYTHWEMYAIGGSANPTINSQGNRFLAPDDSDQTRGCARERVAKLELEVGGGFDVERSLLQADRSGCNVDLCKGFKSEC